MLRKKYSIILLIITIILMSVLSIILIYSKFNSATNTSTNISERKILFWYDPMYPGTKFNNPGPSPFMDMDLVPKYADDNEDETIGVAISAGQTQNLGLRTAIVKTGQLDYQFNFPAVINFNKYQYETIHAKAAGFVEKSYPLTIGDYVRKGDPLVDITVSDWISAQSEYLTLLKTKASSELLFAVEERLYLAGMPTNLIHKLKSTRKIQRYITIYAPISGVLTSYDLLSGMTMNRSSIIATIEGIDPVWVVTAVPESLAELLTKQNKENEQIKLVQFNINVPAMPNKPMEIIDWQVLANVQEQTRTLTLRIVVNNPEHKLKPGMSATVRVKTTSQPYLLVPSEAIINSGDEQRVIIQDSEGRFVPQQVVIYGDANGKTAILDGLKEGQKVVTSGLFLIDSEANINGALDRMRQRSNSIHHNNVDHSNKVGEQ